MLPPGRVSLHLLDYEGHRKCLLEPATDVGPRGLVLDPCTALARVLMGASCVYPAPAPTFFSDGLEERLGSSKPSHWKGQQRGPGYCVPAWGLGGRMGP